MIKIHVGPGEEIMKTVAKQVKEQGIQNGAIVTLFGAINSCCISNMPKEDAKKDILTEYHQPFEVSGSGEIKDGKPHIHLVLGREGDQTLSGHLHWAKVKTWFVNLYILPL